MNVNFTTRILTNKTLLKTLEKISEHGTTFSAGTSLVMSLSLRPLAILTTPDTEKENKQYAASNSIGSGLIKFAMLEAVALPIENAVKNIDKNPDKFLNSATLKKLAGNSKDITTSKSYKLLTQIIKLSSGLFTAIPKSILTIAFIPIIMDKIFQRKSQSNYTNSNNNEQIVNFGSKPSFTGKFTDKISKEIGKLLNNESLQNFAIKFQNNDKDIAKHMCATTDVLLTSTAIYETNKSTKIKENRKKALIYNNIISTAITILGGYMVDKIISCKSNGFIEKFKKLNANDPKLAKYIEGINILRPAVIFAGIYYGILPIFSTYMSEKIDKYIANNSDK